MHSAGAGGDRVSRPGRKGHPAGTRVHSLKITPEDREAQELAWRRSGAPSWSAWIKHAAAVAIACQELGDRVPRALRALALQYRGAGLEPDAAGLEALAEMIERGEEPRKERG